MENRSTKSYIMMTASMLVFGSIGIFRKYISLSSGLLACSRGMLGAFVLFLFLKIGGNYGPGSGTTG